MNKHLMDKMQIVAGVIPVNLATAANNGDFVSMKGYGRCAIVLFKGIGTAGEDPVITIEQATDVAGTGTKVVDFSRIDTKVGTQTGIGTFTKTAVAAGGTYVDAVSGEAEGLFVIDIKAEDLDIDAGFDCIRAKVADVGTTTQLGGVLYLLHEPRNATDPLPSAIVD